MSLLCSIYCFKKIKGLRVSSYFSKNESFSPSGSEFLHCSVDNFVAARGLGNVFLVWRGQYRAKKSVWHILSHFTSPLVFCLIFLIFLCIGANYSFRSLSDFSSVLQSCGIICLWKEIQELLVNWLLKKDSILYKPDILSVTYVVVLFYISHLKCKITPVINMSETFNTNF